MYWPTAILIVAVVLLILEFFVPSAGVLGVLSGLAFLGAIVTAFTNGGAKVGMLFTVATAAVIPLAMYLALKWWPHTPIGRRMLIQPPEGDDAVPLSHRERQSWIGQSGVAITSMLPAGAIRLGDRTVDAISDGMPIEAGTAVVVVAVRGYHLLVRPQSFDNVGEIPPVEPTRGDRSLDLPVSDPFDGDPFNDSLS